VAALHSRCGHWAYIFVLWFLLFLRLLSFFFSSPNLSRRRLDVYHTSTHGYWTTRGYANSRIANSRTGQLADATGDFACLVFILLAASARPPVVQSARCAVRELAIRELAYPRVVQLPFHTWCGLSANLGCRSETCCTWLAEIQDAKNHQKFAICAPCTTLLGSIFATKARIDNQKKTC